MRTIDPHRGQQILDCAAQLFAKGHYHEVRMEDIAAQAGVAKGTLYRYFADKEDLYVALLVNGMERLLDESRSKVAGPGAAEERLQTFFNGVVRFYERQPYYLELWARVESSRSAASVSALKAIRGQFFHLLTALIRELNASGRFATTDPDWSALALMGVVRNILRFVPQPWPPHLPGWMCHQFLHGLSVAPPARAARQTTAAPAGAIS